MRNSMPLFLALAMIAAASGPVYPPGVSGKDVPALLKATSFVRALGEAELLKMVPEQSGLYFVGCPNCTSGKQEGQLAWTPERPGEVYCRFCNHRYPSAQYPMDHTLVVRNPRGQAQRYPYWEDSKGYRYFFQARHDDFVKEYLASATADLARLYAATGDRTYARLAALLLDRFAEVFPGWCYHYDYPFRQKEIYDGVVPPAKFRPGYRTARWNWWAYKDIPDRLVQAYDWIRESGVFAELSRERGTDVAARIERDLFRNAAEQVLANPESYGNMSPGCWRSLITVGRVIAERRYVEEPVRRFREFVATRFFYDGAWPEGAPSYHQQTVRGLASVLRALRGDPDEMDESRLPALKHANGSLQKMRLPDGRLVPVHDTWGFDRREPLAETKPFLLPALGHACLGGGAGEAQAQFHLTWSGGYGHQHADNLSLLVFAHGRELLSDLGYTHTRYRSWTLSTAAHNTVVIDGQSQEFGGLKTPSDGSLRWYDVSDPRVQVVSAEGNRGYPGARVYRRTLLVIDAGESRRYAVDMFEVDGGRVHDYFLHGDADGPATAAAALSLEPLATLLPPGFSWTPTRNEGEAGRASEPNYAYGFLRNLRAGPAPADTPLPVRFQSAQGAGPGVRVTLFPEPGSRLVLGENPSIRRAREDDARLDDFERPFLLLRHETASGRSVFVSVIEPYGGAPYLAIERLKVAGAGAALAIHCGARTDYVVYEAPRPVAVADATFAGEIGVLSIANGKVGHAWALGRGGWVRGEFRLSGSGPRALPLRAVEPDGFLLGGSRELPAAGSVVRLSTADGWVYPYTVVEAERSASDVRVRVAEGPGLTYDPAGRQLRLTAFPQREHAGAVRVEWQPIAAGPYSR